MRSKIDGGIMKETNVPFMFNDKYCVLRYMELNELIDLSSNDDVEEELVTYNALYKTVEAKEYESNSQCSDSDYSPLDDVDDIFIDICYDFMNYLEENFPDIVTESKIHSELRFSCYLLTGKPTSTTAGSATVSRKRALFQAYWQIGNIYPESAIKTLELSP